MKKDKRIKFTEAQVKAAQEECGHKLEKLNDIGDVVPKVIGGCTAIAFWFGVFSHVWIFFFIGICAIFLFAMGIFPFIKSAEKKEYLACRKYRRLDLIQSGYVFDPVTGEKLQ